MLLKLVQLFGIACLGLFSVGTRKASSKELPQAHLKTFLKHDVLPNDLDLSLSKFKFYLFSVNDRNYYLADVLDNNLENTRYYEIRLVVNPCPIDSVPTDYLNTEYLLEVISKEDSKREADYYSLNENQANEIISNAEVPVMETDVYNRLVTSFNAYYSNALQNSESSENRMVSRVRGNVNTANTDEQAPLDYFLATKDIQNTTVLDSSVFRVKDNFPKQYQYDSAIASLLPRSHFLSVGVHYGIGSEWGYYINTVQDKDDTLLSQVLLYDIIQFRANESSSDQVTLKVVDNQNYKYYPADDVILKYGQNNLCLGNPQLESNISYIQCSDNQNNHQHLNPSDRGYNRLFDYGFCFGDIQVCHYGRGKNKDKKVSGAKALRNMAVDAASAFINFGSGTVATLGSFAAGKALSYAANSAFDYFTADVHTAANQDEGLSKDGNKYKYNYIYQLNEESNFGVKQKNDTLNKSSFIRMPSYSGNDEKTKYKYIENNLQTPLLFKTEEDSANFRHSILSSELKDDYTAVISHQLSFDIFNDDSSLFKFDPQFLLNTGTAWGYLYGESVNPKQNEITDINQPIGIAYGTDYPQEILFTPKISSSYDIILSNATHSSMLNVDGEHNVAVSRLEDPYPSVFFPKDDKSGNNSEADKIKERTKINCTYKINLSLAAGTTYRIRCDRLYLGTRRFGTATLKIYQANKGMGYVQERKIENSTSGQILNTIEYSGLQQTNHFYSKEDTIVTIALNSLSTNMDTYLVVLDDKYRPVRIDDDGFGGKKSRAYH